MKIIFLDIDGVLNSQLYYERSRVSIEAGYGFPESQIDPRSVELLNGLIADTNAGVVVSSVWRLGRTIDELQRLLVLRGFKGNIIGKTLDLHSKERCCFRGNEIYKWIQDNVPHAAQDELQYVIFDDDSDMLLWQKDNFIHVDSYAGLSPNNCYKAMRILNKK